MARARQIESIPYRPPLAYALDLEVMSMGELRRRVPVEHRHLVHRIEFHMLILVTRGTFTHMVDFDDYRCARGVLLALRPGQVQRFERAPGWDGWITMFRPEFLLPLQGPTGDVHSQVGVGALPTSLRLGPPMLEAAVEGLQRIHADAGTLPAGPETGALLRHQLTALLLRLALGQADRSALAPGSAASLQRFRRFQAAVERDYVRDHGVAGYAQRLGCSERSLTRATLECAGVSAKAYLVNRIVLEAKRLLAHTAAPVSNVADDLGFAEATNFVKFFRREAGCSPGSFDGSRPRPAGTSDSPREETRSMLRPVPTNTDLSAPAITLSQRLRNRLVLPVIGAPLFIVSNPDLVIAQCTSGVVGSFPALNARPAEVLDEWIERIVASLAAYEREHPGAKVAPFAVNQIIHQSNDRLDHDLDACVRHRVPIIITSLRAPNDVVKRVHDYGGVVFHDVISIRHAEKALEAGVDGLVLVCAGAGGHAGTLSPFALVREVRRFFDGPIALSGAITDGAGVLAAEAMGADFAYLGTRFVASREANATEGYKQAIVDSAAADIVYTPYFTGVHGNYLKSSIANAGLDPTNLPEVQKTSMDFGTGRGKESGKKPWKDIWGAGQGVGNIADAPPAREVVERLVREYAAARARLGER